MFLILEPLFVEISCDNITFLANSIPCSFSGRELLFVLILTLPGMFFFLIFLFKDVIYLFLESAEGRAKERERNINVRLPLVGALLGTWPTTQACALTGN